ncbi:Tetratricopeptide-like helical domain superfamily [Babesia duncani]|uniref:Tetratricopeptide-like helical domain superfamily n=1 Tax=Babesia duncani TaxID=323732 RepID=A0AAD9PKH8_9APIC|nr:Tetratricopeptide-like helical domain superfamily [Babesia duncani]
MNLKPDWLDSALTAISKDDHDTIEFLKDFERTYVGYLLNCSWSELKAFLEDSLAKLDKTSIIPYSKKAAYLLKCNNTVLLNMDTEYITENWGGNTDILIYPGFVSTLVLPGSIKLYNTKSRTGLHQIDVLLSKYDLYNCFYALLVDVLIYMDEFNVAVELLLELGVVLYYIRLELDNEINSLNYLSKQNGFATVGCGEIRKKLLARGINLEGVGDVIGSKLILAHIIDYWNHENSIEIWSRIFKLWMGEKSLAKLFEKLNSLDLSTRWYIFNCMNLDFTPYSNKSNVMGDLKLRVKKGITRNFNKFTFSFISMLNHILKGPINCWRFSLEGFMFIAQLFREIDFNTYCFLYVLLNNVSRIYKTVVGTYRLVNTHNDKWNLRFRNRHDSFKGTKSNCKIPTIIQIIDNQHSLNSVYMHSSMLNVPIYIKFRNKSGLVDIGLELPLKGVQKYVPYSQGDTEAQMWFELSNPPREEFVGKEMIQIHAKKAGSRYNISCMNGQVNVNNEKLFSLVDICLDGIIIDGYFDLSVMNFRLNHRHDFYTFTLNSDFLCKSNKQPIVKGLPDNIILPIIGFCFVVDKMCSMLNYTQAAEFLRFKDQLRKQKCAIARKLFPCLPSRTPKETKEVLSFQKHIKGIYKHKMISTYSEINTTSSSSVITKRALQNVASNRIFFRIKQYGQAFRSSFINRQTIAPEKKRVSLAHKFTYLKSRIRMATWRFCCCKRKKRFSNTMYTVSIIDQITVTDPTKCIHELFTKEPQCTELQWQHLNHLIVLIDMLSHYGFTNWLSLSQINCSGCHRFGKLYLDPCEDKKNPSFNLDLIKAIRNAFKYNVGVNVRMNLQKTFMPILNELLENAILFSQATFFREGYYRALLSRLAIVQLFQGHWKLALVLMDQALLENKHYNIGCKPGNTKDRDCAFSFNRHFMHLTMASIMIEMLHLPYESIKILEPLLDASLVGTQIASKANFTLGMAFFKIAQDVVIRSQMDFIEFFELYYATDKDIKNLLLVDSREQQQVHEQVNDAPNTDDGSYKSEMPTKGELSSKGHPIIRAMEHMLYSVSLDPLDYKGWLQLAHVALYGHDFYFAKRSCLKSIDLCNSYVKSWLTLGVIESCPARTCGPISCPRTIWHSYLESSRCEKLENTSNLESIPMPLEPIFSTVINSPKELSRYLSQCAVGGDFEQCLHLLYSLRKFKSIHAYCAFVEYAAALSDLYVGQFPWELPNKSLLQRWRAGDNFSILIESSVSTRVQFECAKFDDIVKPSTIAQSFVCCVPLLNCLANLLMPGSGTFECCHHDAKAFDPFNYKMLQEEICGWICVIELLMHIDQCSIARGLFVIVHHYMRIYSIKRNDIGRIEVETKPEHGIEGASHLRSRYTEYAFSNACALSNLLNTQVQLLELELSAFEVFSKPELFELLSNIQKQLERNPCRRLELLEIRVLVGVNMYQQAISACTRTFSKTPVGTFLTDFKHECNALVAYAVALAAFGEEEKSWAIESVAQVLYKSSPLLKYSLCLF